MAKKRLIAVALIFLLFAGGFAVWFFALPASQVTPADAGRVTKGMTLTEVEAFLGKSVNGDASGANVWVVYAMPEMKLMWSFRFHGVIYEADYEISLFPVDLQDWKRPESGTQAWCGREGALVAHLDASRRVQETRWLPGRVSPTYQPDLLSWLKRVWGEHFLADPPKDVP